MIEQLEVPAESRGAAMPHVSRIDIKDLFATRNMSFEPSTLTLLKGGNGVGKSSVLNALMRLLDGGHDPASLRRGAKVGQLRIELSDGSVISMRVTPTATTREVRNDQGEIVPKPAEAINALFAAYDPTAIVKADAKQMGELLTKIMPIHFAPADFKGIAQVATPISTVDLDGLAKIRKSVYDRRTSVNGAVKQSSEVEKDIRSSLPEKDEDAAELKSQMDHFRSVRSKLNAALSDKLAEIDADVLERIEEIVRRAEAEKEEVKRLARELKTTARAEVAEELAKVDAAIGSADQKIQESIRTQTLRKRLEKARVEIRQGNLEADELTQALASLDELRAAKLKNLPIPELTMEDGRVMYNGLPWTKEIPNTGERLLLGFRIGELLQKGRVPFFICDAFSDLDADNLGALREALAAKGYQAIGAKVGEGELAIEAA